jgi:protein-L-isoaspartate O-methyltransferase
MLLAACPARPAPLRPRRVVARRGASFDAWPPADARSALSFAPFTASPEGAVAAMLTLAALRPGETLLDLGCGDGRVLRAALAWGAGSVTGWELDSTLCDEARAALARDTQATAQTARVVCGDCRDAERDVAAADVVTLFLLPEGLEALSPMVRRRHHSAHKS